MDCYTVFFHAGHVTISKMETVRFLPVTGIPMILFYMMNGEVF